MAKASIEKLLGESYDAKVSRLCWAKLIEGDAARYIRALEEREEHPVFRRVSTILGEHFSVRVSPSSVGVHFRGECRCRA